MNKSWNSRTEKGREEIDAAVMDKITKAGVTIRALCDALTMKESHVRASLSRLEEAEKIEPARSRRGRAFLYKPKGYRTWPVKAEHMQTVHSLEREMEAYRRDGTSEGAARANGIAETLEALRSAIEAK